MNITPGAVVCLAGAVLAGGSAIALATTSSERGGQAVAPLTTKAPHLPKQARGHVIIVRAPAVGYRPVGLNFTSSVSSTVAVP